MSKHRIYTSLVLTAITVTMPKIAYAYIGPGAGVSLIGSFLGILVAVLIAVFALIAWPIRRMRKARKAHNKTDEASNNIDRAK